MLSPFHLFPSMITGIPQNVRCVSSITSIRTWPIEVRQAEAITLSQLLCVNRISAGLFPIFDLYCSMPFHSVSTVTLGTSPHFGQLWSHKGYPCHRLLHSSLRRAFSIRIHDVSDQIELARLFPVAQPAPFCGHASCAQSCGQSVQCARPKKEYHG